MSGPIRMVKQFLPHLKTKSAGRNHENVSSGLAFCSIAHFTGLFAPPEGRPPFVYQVTSGVQLKNTEVKVFELAPPASTNRTLGRLLILEEHERRFYHEGYGRHG